MHLNKELEELRNYFNNLEEGINSSETKKHGLRFIELTLHLKEENDFLKRKIHLLEKDSEWLESKVNEWMTKAMQNSQARKR
jgi:flagellar motor component MotA